MLNNTEDKEDKGWEISIGFYPGILFGSRVYQEPEYDTWVLYLPFVDVAITIEK